MVCRYHNGPAYVQIHPKPLFQDVYKRQLFWCIMKNDFSFLHNDDIVCDGFDKMCIRDSLIGIWQLLFQKSAGSISVRTDYQNILFLTIVFFAPINCCLEMQCQKSGFILILMLTCKEIQLCKHLLHHLIFLGKLLLNQAVIHIWYRNMVQQAIHSRAKMRQKTFIESTILI